MLMIYNVKYTYWDDELIRQDHLSYIDSSLAICPMNLSVLTNISPDGPLHVRYCPHQISGSFKRGTNCCTCERMNNTKMLNYEKVKCVLKYKEVHRSEVYPIQRDDVVCASCEKRSKCLRYKLLYATDNLHEDIKKAILENTKCSEGVK